MEGEAEKGRDRVRAGEPAAAAAPTMVSRSPLRDLRKKAARVTGAHHAFSPKKPRPSPSPPPELAAPAPEPLSLDDCARDEAAAETKEDPDADMGEAGENTTDREVDAVWVLGYRVDKMFSPA